MAFEKLAAGVLVAIWFPLAAWSQYGSGTILGSVSDPTGALVPAAKVTAKNNATGDERESASALIGIQPMKNGPGYWRST